MKIMISNDFTGRETTVDTSRPLTKDKIRLIRKRLCHKECRSGDILGARGRQDDPEAYQAFHQRAEDVLSLGNEPRRTQEEIERDREILRILFGIGKK